MPRVRVLGGAEEDAEARVRELRTEEGLLVDLAFEHDLPLLFGCQSARCGVCRVRVVEGALAEPGRLERAALEGMGCAPGERLACQAYCDRDVTLRALCGGGAGLESRP